MKTCILLFCAFCAQAQNTTPACNFCPATVFVPGGAFQMGSNTPEADSDEQPVHDVTLSGFWLGKYEVTVGEYLVFVNETRTHYPEWLEPGNRYHADTGADTLYRSKGYSRSATHLPVVGISWYDAAAYCDWLRQKTGNNYRLPTEAEWEYAARGGAKSRKTQYCGSNTPDSVAWHRGNGARKPHLVGQKKPNELDCYDLSGNVWEWCADWRGPYPAGACLNPAGPAAGRERILRGGAYNAPARFCRAANRLYERPDFRFAFVGFRVAR